MAAGRIIKSCVYLGLFGTLGYVLMKISEPSEEKKRAIAKTGYKDPSSNESKLQKALFLEKLKEATTNTPIYLKKSPSSSAAAAATPAEKEAPKQPSKREIN